MGVENTIVLKGKGHHEEGVLDGVASPGMAVALAADGHYDQVQDSQSAARRRGLKILKEDAYRGGTIDTAYASGDIGFIYEPVPGDHVHVLVKDGEVIAVNDTLDVEGSGSGLFVEMGSTETDELKLSEFKVHDSMGAVLPAAAANDDMGAITGTPGTDVITLQGVDFGGTATDEKSAVEYELPEDYVPGSAITVRVRASMLTTVSDGTATVDVEAWLAGSDGASGADLCTTAAQSINSLTLANKDFVITPTGLVPGSKLVLRFSFGGSDTGNVGVMIPEITEISVIRGNVNPGRLEALEAVSPSGANDHVKCRVVSV